MNEILTDPIVEFFEWYVLYDIPIISLHFDFQEQSITLKIDECDRHGEDVELSLVFKKASKYTFEYPADEFSFNMIAIYRINFAKMQEGYYEITLLIDMPENKLTYGTHYEFTVGKMLIGFADLEVIGGLSREKMEYKWKEAE